MNLINTLKPETTNLFNAKKAASNNWKESNFSLFGIINYVSKNLATDKDLKDALSCVDALTGCKTQADIKEVLTVDYIKTCLGEKGLNKWLMNEETGKRDIKGDAKTRFSLWSVLSAIQRVNKK